jgi:hypothetical protein
LKATIVALVVVVIGLAASSVYYYAEVGNNAGQENGIPIASVDTCYESLAPKYTNTIFSYWAGLLGLPYNNMTWVGGAIYNGWPEPVNSTYFALYVTGVFNYSFDKPVTSSSTTYTTPLMLWVQYCRLTA